MSHSRRSFLKLTSGLALGAPLAGCGSRPLGESGTGSAMPYADAADVGLLDASVDGGQSRDAGGERVGSGDADAGRDVAQVEDAGIADADVSQADAGPTDVLLEPDRGPDAPIDAGAGITLEAFSVTLLDESCSGHQHGFYVVAGTYADDEPIMFMGGGHAVYYRPSELLQLQEGAVLPFHTNGDGGHGHCGTAVRSEDWQQTEMLVEGAEGCQIQGDAYCSLRM